MNRYEQVPYGSRPFPEAHPDHLCVVARLFGVSAPDPATARVLELGCGSGMHLAPIGARLPGARCVGVDLAAGAIAEARRTNELLGGDVAFLEGDLLDLEPILGRPDLPEAYDYVVAHGLYSWVGPEQREALLAACARWLAPNGVAYVSYNARPGWHVRGMMAEMLRFHAGGFEEPQKQVDQARALLRFLAETVPDTDPYGAWLRRESRLVEAQPDAWVFHDLLSEHNHAVLVADFAAHAHRHGLVYLGDADLPSMLPDRLPTPVRRVLESLSGDLLRSEQYLDFVLCRNFRRTLLVRPGAPIDRALTWDRLRPLWIAGTLDLEGLDETGLLFRTRAGDTLSTAVPLLSSALRLLADQRPRPIPFDEVVRVAQREAGAGDPGEVELIGRNLLVCYARGAIELYPRPLELAPWAGERPVVEPVVRALALLHDAVPSGLHEGVRVEGVDRLLIPRLDGTRTREDLERELVDALSQTADRAQVERFVLGAVPERLDRYAREGLLVA
jgi:SAM-dependent methyltransferase